MGQERKGKVKMGGQKKGKVGNKEEDKGADGQQGGVGEEGGDRAQIFQQATLPPIILWKVQKFVLKKLFWRKILSLWKISRASVQRIPKLSHPSYCSLFFCKLERTNIQTQRGGKCCILAVITETPFYVGNAKEISDTNDKSNVPCLK